MSKEDYINASEQHLRAMRTLDRGALLLRARYVRQLMYDLMMMVETEEYGTNEE